MKKYKYLDSKETLLLHQKIIAKKPILNKVYQRYYRILRKVPVPKGKIVEFGSGGGFLKKYLPEVITSDLLKINGIDKAFSAEKIPFSSQSVSAFYLLNVFHHIKNPVKALREMERCLKKGGKIIMVEPFNTFWSRLVFKFHNELFDTQASWKVDGKGRLSDANMAIPWIIFVRDRKIFEKMFKNLKIEKIKPIDSLSYFFSGGLSFPQLLPTFFYPFIRKMDSLFPSLGLFAIIVLKKS